MTGTISSRQNALVARCRAVAAGDDPAAILLDGPHLVEEALTSSLRLQHAIVAATACDRPAIRRLVEQLTTRGCAVSAATAPVMAAVSPVRSPSAIVVLAERPHTPATQLYGGIVPLIVIAWDVQDPGNMGAIARVTEAAGGTGMVAAGSSADPFGWKALRGSMGSALRLPIAVQRTASEALTDAAHHGCRLVATASADGQSLFTSDLTGPIAVLIGAEGSGLPSHVVERADVTVTIPMEPPVESLNAAVTAALVLYEARRQRR